MQPARVPNPLAELRKKVYLLCQERGLKGVTQKFLASQESLQGISNEELCGAINYLLKSGKFQLLQDSAGEPTGLRSQ